MVNLHGRMIRRLVQAAPGSVALDSRGGVLMFIGFKSGPIVLLVFYCLDGTEGENKILSSRSVLISRKGPTMSVTSP